MCGRYQSWVEDHELVRIIEREKEGNALKYLRRSEVFPGSESPVIYGSYANVRAHISVWGYAQDGGKSGRLIINARSESALNKPMFINAASNTVPSERRILVPASAYYEWTGEGVGKMRCRIGPRSKTAILLCGLEADRDDGTRRHVILTTDSSGSVSDVHPRMPLICPRESMRLWLYDTDFAVDFMKRKHECDLSVVYA